MKILPQAEFKTAEDAFIPKPKLQSRRYLCKVLFMGLICPPVKDKNNGNMLSDGKIMLKHVSEELQQQKSLYNQNFVSKYEINHALKNHKWILLFPKENFDLTAKDILALIAEEYELDDGISSDLVLTYHTFSQARVSKKLTKKLMKLTTEDNRPLLGSVTRKFVFKYLKLNLPRETFNSQIWY